MSRALIRKQFHQSGDMICICMGYKCVIDHIDSQIFDGAFHPALPHRPARRGPAVDHADAAVRHLQQDSIALVHVKKRNLKCMLRQTDKKYQKQQDHPTDKQGGPFYLPLFPHGFLSFFSTYHKKTASK